MTTFFPFGPASPNEMSSSVQLSRELLLLGVVLEAGIFSPSDLRLKDARGVLGLRNSRPSRDVLSPSDFLFFLTSRLDMGRSNAEAGRKPGTGLNLPFSLPLIVAVEVVEELETMRGGKS
jgi:hypothetical protein